MSSRWQARGLAQKYLNDTRTGIGYVGPVKLRKYVDVVIFCKQPRSMMKISIPATI